MFFDPERIGAVRADDHGVDEAGRRAALAQLLPFQREDFHELFHIMGDLPVTIRLLDPPLHEFLPHGDVEVEKVAHRSARTSKRCGAAPRSWHEANPMLGHRGCRLGIAYPEIYEMQARAIFEGALIGGEGDRKGAGTGDHDPAGGGCRRSWRSPAPRVDEVAEEVFAGPGHRIEYSVGTMIELPRAALSRRTRSPRKRTSSASAPTT